mmetsp:Transcript_10817/g.14328  ORF Transcript_10817/g.14328 Transcript_10817/m.14328 type:complete len:194 (+) Transcript_10817:435-1016(+)
MPVAMVGAESLQARLVYQQSTANSVADQLHKLEECRQATHRRYDSVQSKIAAVQQRQIRQRQKLLDVMQRVEVFRCYNNPLQDDEIKAMQKTADLYQKADRLTSSMRSLQKIAKDKADKDTTTTSAIVSVVDLTTTQANKIPDEAQLLQVLINHREEMTKLVTTVQKDLRDLDLIKHRLETTTAPRLALPSRV